MKSALRNKCGIMASIILASAGGIAFAELDGQKSLRKSLAGDVVIPIEEASFGPSFRYGDSEKVSVARLWADVHSGRFSQIVRLTKGAVPKHTHPFDGQVVVLEGTMQHWMADFPEGSVKQLGPGSYWYQPKEKLHQNICLSDKCAIFVTWGVNFTSPEDAAANAPTK